MNTLNLKPGDLIVGDGHGFTAALQHWVNGKGATHGCVVTYPTGSKQDIPLLLSAEYNGVVHETWDNFIKDPKYNFWVYEIIGGTQEENYHALDYGERTFLGDVYGYASWLWFGWAGLWIKILNPIGRFLHLKFLQHDVLSENNWFTKGTFCTEHCWYHIYKYTELHPTQWVDIRTKICNQYPDTFQPIQWTNLLQDKRYFRLKWQRVNGVITEF
jgi:hypothetical protein